MWQFFYKYISLLSLQAFLIYKPRGRVKPCSRIFTACNNFISLFCLTQNIFIQDIRYFLINLAYLIKSICKLHGNFVRFSFLLIGLFVLGILLYICKHLLRFKQVRKIEFLCRTLWFVSMCWFSLRSGLDLYICTLLQVQVGLRCNFRIYLRIRLVHLSCLSW